MSTFTKSDKLTLVAVAIGIVVGIAFYHFGSSVKFSAIMGVIVAAFALKGLQEGAAATSVIDSKAINKE